MTDDPTTRLLAAIDLAEQNALLATQPGQWAAAAGWRPIVRAQVVDLDGKTHFDSVTRAILIRCAADRKMLELHAPFHGHCLECHDSSGETVPSPCDTLRLFAEGYGLTTEPAP